MLAPVFLLFGQEVSSLGSETLACPSTTPSGLLIIYTWLGGLLLGVSIIGLIIGVRKRLYVYALLQFMLALLFIAIPAVDSLTDNECGIGGFFSDHVALFYFAVFILIAGVITLNYKIYKRPEKAK